MTNFSVLKEQIERGRTGDWSEESFVVFIHWWTSNIVRHNGSARKSVEEKEEQVPSGPS